MRAQVRESGDIQPDLAWLIGNYVEAGVGPLRAGLILIARAEKVIPGSLGGVFIIVNGATSGEAHERLHVRVLFPVPSVPVRDRELVCIAEMVIEAAGGKVLPRIVRKQPPIIFKLIH